VVSSIADFLDSYFQRLQRSFDGDAVEQAREFSGELRYRLHEERGGVLGHYGSITDYVLGLDDAAEGINDLWDLEVLRKRFLITRTFLEILNRVPVESLGSLTVVARRDEVDLTPDFLGNPYLEVKGDPGDPVSSRTYSPVFLVELEVYLDFGRVNDLLAAVTRGEAMVRFSGDRDEEVRLSTVIRSLRILKAFGDPEVGPEDAIQIDGAMFNGLDEASRELAIRNLKATKVAEYSRPIKVELSTYVLDFVDAETARALVQGSEAATDGRRSN
jgi:hypothetical protein